MEDGDVEVFWEVLLEIPRDGFLWLWLLLLGLGCVGFGVTVVVPI